MRYIFTTLTLILFILCANSLDAQYFKGKESYKQLVKKADLAYANSDYLYALEYARRAARIDTSNLDLWCMVGETATKLTIIDEAKTAYLMAAAHEDRARYPLIDFNLANIQKMFGEYHEAIKNYQRFINEYEGSDKVNAKAVTEAKKHILDSKKAILYDGMTSEAVASVKRVDSKFNAACRSTFAPYLDGDDLYFTSLFYPSNVDTMELGNAQFNIFKQDLNRPSSNAEPIGDEGGRNGHFALSLDKQYMYYTICEYQKLGNYRCEIYCSKKNTNNTWSSGERLPEGINLSNYNTTQAAIGEDEAGNEVLFFASNRPDATGATDMDIWQSRIEVLSDGRMEYQTPENLTAINTSGNDVTPFYHQKCETLYFSTDGRPSLGNLDIYQAKRNGKTWAKPTSMGYPINSSFDDNYFFRSEAGTKAYFASNRITLEDLEQQNCKGCCPSIYEAPMNMPAPTLELMAYCGTDALDDFTYTLNKGEFRDKALTYDTPINLEANIDYELEIQKTDYKPANLTINIAGLCDSSALQERVYMLPHNNLTVQLFGKSITGTSPLDAVDRVRIIGTDRMDEIREDVIGSAVSFSVQPNTTYKVIVDEEGYASDSISIITGAIETLCTLDESIILKENSLIDLPLPATLYFHNAIPSIENQTDKGAVNISYRTTYESYIKLIDTYQNQLTNYYTKNGNTTKASVARDTVDGFFKYRVEEGYRILKLYADALLPHMKKGKRAQICIQGMASPLASDSYNKYLSERRINSVRNFLKEHNNGALAPYIDDELTIKELPIGEAKGTPEMEGRIYGVYAPESALLRKVTIIDIQDQGAGSCLEIEQ